jgi:hypothetical protein
MKETKPSEWSSEERDRPVTGEVLWYELDTLRRTFDTKLKLLGRKGERAARFPEPGWERDPFRAMYIETIVLIVLMWAISAALILLGAVR